MLLTEIQIKTQCSTDREGENGEVLQSVGKKKISRVEKKEIEKRKRHARGRGGDFIENFLISGDL